MIWRQHPPDRRVHPASGQPNVLLITSARKRCGQPGSGQETERPADIVHRHCDVLQVEGIKEAVQDVGVAPGRCGHGPGHLVRGSAANRGSGPRPGVNGQVSGLRGAQNRGNA